MIPTIFRFPTAMTLAKKHVLLWIALLSLLTSYAQTDVHKAVKNLLDKDTYTYDFAETGDLLIQDVLHQTDEVFVGNNLLKTYVEASIVPTLEQNLSPTEVTEGVLSLHREKSADYQSKTKYINDFIARNNISGDEFEIYTTLPLTKVTYMSPGQEIIGQQVVLYLAGDGSKMLMLLASMLTFKGEAKILELDEPDTYLDLSEGDYATIYQKFTDIFEKLLQGKINDKPSALFGEKVDGDWYKSTVQIFDQVGTTYVKSMIVDDWEYLVEHEYPNVVFFRMLSDADYNTAYNLMLEMVAVSSMSHYIFATKENNLTTDVLLDSYAEEVLSENTEKGITTAEFYFRQAFENVTFCEVKYELTKTPEGKAHLDIWILQEL